MANYKNETKCPNSRAFEVSDLARRLNEETLATAQRVVASGEFDMDELEIEEPL